ncbi:MAG: sugar ABC transporter permease [Clostridia bacterium]|nr:sugar ABC transporter permease [Clostridia bacterium]
MAARAKKIRSLERKKSYAGYFFVLPFIIGVCFVFLPMIIEMIRLSFSTMIKPTVAGQSYTLDFAGLTYYKVFFTKDAWFLQLTWTTALNSLIDFICILFFSFFIAVLLNQEFRGRSLARVLFFIPVVVMTGVIAQVDSGSLANSIGSVDSIVDVGAQTAVSLPTVADLLQGSNVLDSRLVSVITAVITRMSVMVNGSGVQILLFLAGLQAISPAVYEAASIEGCSGWETFWKITLPMMSPIILLNAVYTAIECFTNTNNTVIRALLNMVNNQHKYSEAAARAVIYLLIVAVVVGIIFLLGKKLVFYRE